MSKLGKPISQRQLRVGEMIKQALGMIFLRDEAKIGTFDTKEMSKFNSIEDIFEIDQEARNISNMVIKSLIYMTKILDLQKFK